MKVSVDGQILTVFRTESQPHGWVGLFVGTDKPARCVSVPRHWWEHGRGVVITSGTRVSKGEA